MRAAARGAPAGLREARTLLREFHRRNADDMWEAPWRGPEELWCIGHGKQVLYSSDKANPDDPTDPGGTWHGYFHDHEPSTLVFVTPKRARGLLGYEPPPEIRRPRWPDLVTWLGTADGYQVRIGRAVRDVRLDGRRNMKGLQLWGFPCPRFRGDCYDLVAAPAGGGREEDTVLWCGPDLTITWAGIDG